MPFISIVIPTFNRAKLISRAIESVKAQTFDDWELVIVDDGSTDDTEVKIAQYLYDKRIHYIKKNNTGAADTRNVGASLASGKWLTFLDSDDEAQPTWLTEISTASNEADVGVVCCGLAGVDESGKIIYHKFPKKMSKVFHEVNGRFTNGGIFVLQKSCFEAIGGYDPELKSGQHTELAIRLISYLKEKQLRISTVNKPLIWIHIHRGERIRSNNRALYEGSKRFTIKHAEILRQDSNMMVDYLNSISVSAARLGYLEEAKKNSRKALLIKPFSWKQWARMIIIHSKLLRTRYYNTK